MSEQDILSIKIDQRIEKALEIKFIYSLVQWAETGDKSDLEYLHDNSRSGLEYQLARQGWFWVGDEGRKSVIKWMDRISPPKWSENKPGSDYRKATIENSWHEKRYDPTIKKSDFHVSQEAVHDILVTLSRRDKAKTSELAEETGLSRSTVSRALNYLIDKGVVIHESHGREDYYVDSGLLQLSVDDLLSDLNSYEVRLEWCRHHL